VNRYTLIWWESADEELTRLWLASQERSRITEAAREIDRLLANQAGFIGDEVHEGLRALEVEPLRVQFSVDDDDRLVRVWTVRLTDS
jgi:hypothetical protein